ncbi:MAG: VCBS repeat-containing protein, partial [Maribacter sp.]
MKTRHLLLLCSLFFLCCEEAPKEIKQSSKLFSLLTSDETGIDFNNVVEDDKERSIFYYANFYGGAGVGIGDFNNDGLEDIYFAGNTVPDKLYINKGDLTFEDTTEKAGIKNFDGWSTGVTVADINNDGYLDIYVSRELYDENPEWRRNLLYLNNGDGTFEEKAEELLIANTERTRHATFLDFDKDGL